MFQRNTGYHSVTACPQRLASMADLRFSNKNKNQQQCQYDYISDIQSKMATLFSQTTENLINSFNKYWEY